MNREPPGFAKASTVGSDPRAGHQVSGRRIERVLFAFGSDDRGAKAAAVACYQNQSGFPVTALHVRPGDRLGSPSDIVPPLHAYRVLLVDSDLMASSGDWLADFGGARILLVHGEPGPERTGPDVRFNATVRMAVDSLDAAALDDAVDAALQRKGAVVRPERQADVAGRNVLVVVPHRPQQDPRIGWMAQAAPAGLAVHQLGIHPPHEGAELARSDERGGLLMSVPWASYVPGEALGWWAAVGEDPPARAAIDRLLWMERALALRGDAFLQLVGATRSDPRAGDFRKVLQHFLDASASLVRQASRLRNVDVVVAADAPALPAAFIIGGMLKARVVFDAHEYWPEADLGSAEFEKRFWEDLERVLVPLAELRVTVSTGLANLMQQRYGVPVMVVPNAELRANLLAPRPAPGAARQPCTFLFQGGFARGRGLELLIEAWPLTDEQALLHLRGPDCDYRDRLVEIARRTGLLGRRIFFPPAVKEDELVRAAAAADVGLVPYEPQGENHRNCCPNKLSQYMAAGLPILANRTAFVSDLVQGAECGLVVDFSDRGELAAAVNRMIADPQQRKAYADKSRHVFDSRFHWEALSREFYSELERLVERTPPRRMQVYGEGVCDNQALAGRPLAHALYEPYRALSARRLALGVWHVLPANLKRVMRRALGRRR